MSPVIQHDQLSLAPNAPLKTLDYQVLVNFIELDPNFPSERSLVESIKTYGLLEPVILEELNEPGEPPRFGIIDGRRRTHAAKEAGLEFVPARVVILDDWSAGSDVLSILLNEQRGPNPVSELQAIERLMAAGKGDREIAKATGMDSTTIRKRLKLARLIPELRDALERGLLRASLAETISALPETLQSGLLLVLAENGRLTAQDVHAAREVRHEAATAVLGDVLAQTPATTDESWAVSVRRLLEQAIERIPNDEGWAWSPLVDLSKQLDGLIKEETSVR